MTVSPLVPVHIEELRAEAVEHGRQANRALAFGENNRARYQLKLAREKTLLALKLEQEAAKP